MTDRVNALIVTLDEDIRVDDVESLMAAIKQLRSVLSVAPNVADADSHVAYRRVRADLSKKLWNILYPTSKQL